MGISDRQGRVCHTCLHHLAADLASVFQDCFISLGTPFEWAKACSKKWLVGTCQLIAQRAIHDSVLAQGQDYASFPDIGQDP